MKGERSRQGRKEGGRMREKKSRRGIWNQEGCRLFRQKIDGTNLEGTDGRKGWEEMEKKMEKAIEKVERNVGKIEEKKRGWWDGECNKKKNEVRREIR